MMATTSLTTLTAGHAFAKSKLTPTDTSRHPPMSYRGNFDDNRVEFANGGIANGDYVDWLSGQPNEATIFEP